MNVLEILGLITVFVGFIFFCSSCSQYSQLSLLNLKRKHRYIIITITLLLNIEGFVCFSSNDGLGSVVFLCLSIFFLELSFGIFWVRYSPSRKFKFIGLLFLSVISIHLALELANVNHLNFKIKEIENQIQLLEEGYKDINSEVEYKSALDEYNKIKYALNEEKENINLWSITSNVLSHSFQTFTLDLDYTQVFIENGFLNLTCKTIARILGLLFIILAPIVGGFVLLSLVSNIYPVLKLHLVCLVPWKKKIYIFSELNEHSIITAESIVADKYIISPVIIFTDVYTDKSKENSSELLDRAKKIGAICLPTDILYLKMTPKFKKNFIFLLMDLEESNNLKTAIDLLAVDSILNLNSKTLIEQNIIGQFDEKRLVEIYVFASHLPNSNVRIEQVEKKLKIYSEEKNITPPFICIVNEIQNAINYFVSNQSRIKSFRENLYDSYQLVDELKILILSEKEDEISDNLTEVLKKMILGNAQNHNHSTLVSEKSNEIKNDNDKNISAIVEKIEIKIFLKEKNQDQTSFSILRYKLCDKNNINQIIENQLCEEYREKNNHYTLISFKDDKDNLEIKEKLKAYGIELGFVMKDEKLGIIYSGKSEKSILSLKERYNVRNIMSSRSIISRGETSIRNIDFYCSNNLISIVIPKSVKSIEDNAFYECSNLSDIYYEGTIGNWSKIEFGNEFSNPLFYANHFYIKSSNKEGKSWEEVKSIIIPKSVEDIGEYAFCGFGGLTSIVIPKNVKSIGYEAFSGCSSLQYNEYDNGLYLGNSENPYLWLIKAKNADITECTINENTKFIYSKSFHSCSNLTSITIPNNVKVIGFFAFYGCRNLKNIIIGNHVKSIETGAFGGCSNLTSIVISNSVKNIESNAFFDCFRLVEIYNLSNLNITAGSRDNGYVGYYAKVIHTTLEEESRLIEKDNYVFIKDYDNKYYLVSYKGTETDLVLPSDIEGNNYEINQRAFNLCYSLTSVIIPKSVLRMGDRAFSWCGRLRSVTIENEMRSIGLEAFYHCTSLTNIIYKGTKEQWLKFNVQKSNEQCVIHCIDGDI